MKRHNLCCASGFVCITKGNNAGERDIKALIKNELCLLGGAAKAVEDNFSDTAGVAIQDLQSFIEGLSAMNNDRQVKVCGDFEVLSKDTFLVFVQRIVLMIVEAGFT